MRCGVLVSKLVHRQSIGQSVTAIERSGNDWQLIKMFIYLPIYGWHQTHHTGDHLMTVMDSPAAAVVGGEGTRIASDRSGSMVKGYKLIYLHNQIII